MKEALFAMVLWFIPFPGDLKILPVARENVGLDVRAYFSYNLDMLGNSLVVGRLALDQVG
jgi:hypothetical protein